MRGKSYDETTKEKAIALFMSGKGKAEVARELKLPYNTVYEWVKTYEESPEFEEFREIKRKEFINSAWKCVATAQTILQRKLDRAIEEEEKLDELLSMLDTDDEIDRKFILNRIAAIKLDDIGKLATVIGTMYDKQALASNQPTTIHGGEVEIKRFEDL